MWYRLLRLSIVRDFFLIRFQLFFQKILNPNPSHEILVISAKYFHVDLREWNSIKAKINFSKIIGCCQYMKTEIFSYRIKTIFCYCENHVNYQDIRQINFYLINGSPSPVERWRRRWFSRWFARGALLRTNSSSS